MKVRADESGIHFFDRRTGVNVLIDEVTPPRRTWARAPRHVSIALTNACDLHCPYCYAPKHGANQNLDKVVAWAEELDANGSLGIGFGGGEPTLMKSFAELCRRVSNRTRLAVSFTTHGHRMTTHLAERLRGYVHFIRLSMDGIGEIYESLRGQSFDRLSQQVNLIRTIAPFGINYVVNSATVGQLDRASELVLEWGASELLLLPERPVKGREGIDASTRKALETWISNSPSQSRLAIADYGVSEAIPIAQPFRDRNRLDAYMHIDADAVAKATSFDEFGSAIGESVMEAIETLREVGGRQ